MTDCSGTPRLDREEDLGFARRPMVGWFNPAQLIRTGTKALLSGIFGAYADKRELQAALQQPSSYDEYAKEEEIWVDYIADLGDGWDSTYTMAKLLAKEQLTIERESQRFLTQRGRILIMGGDQVYPAAKREEYRNRLIGPYQCALPCVLNRTPPHLFAIPGNHDWYDGLTSFTRIFCQGRWVGGWKTQQSRSYFAIKLPHRWWLWGIDIQLNSDIDKPQLDYFKDIAGKDLKKGDLIILCTAEPSWMYGREAYQNLTYFERTIIREHGGILAVALAGDLHHYCRYREDGGEGQRITAGGGGAFLHGTHGLPPTLELIEDGNTVQYSKIETFPDTKKSRLLTLGNLLFPFKNWKFSLFLGGVYLLYAWILQSASKKDDQTFMEKISNLPYSDWPMVLKEFYAVLAHSPAGVVFLFVVIFGLVAFCDAKRRAAKVVLGSVHGILHLLVNVSLIWWFAYLDLIVLGLGIDDLRQVLLFSGETFLFGGLVGGFLMGLYLLLSNLLGLHANEAFSSQRIANYKNFLRLHIGKEGKVTIYAIGVKKVCKKWRFRPGVENAESWFEPAEGDIEAHLIEPPIVIDSGMMVHSILIKPR